MPTRFQHTLARPVTLTGVGFLTGADITVRILPAPSNYGITFERSDISDPVTIPALVEYAVPRSRRTALENEGVSVELVEHLMAALAGLQIDNCRITLNGPEVPGFDGSSQAFVDSFLNTGLQRLDVPRVVCPMGLPISLDTEDTDISMQARPSIQPGLRITYELDYGWESPIPPQRHSVVINPDSFQKEICFARTFILEEEAQAFLAQGLGQRLSYKDLLVYGPNGVIDNELRAVDECARHKILDCIGDLALLGCDLAGHVVCRRTGHRHNADLVRAIKQHNVQLGCKRRAA